MVVAADNIFLTLTIVAACFLLLLGKRSSEQRMKLVFGGLGVAAGIVALALLADALTGNGAG